MKFTQLLTACLLFSLFLAMPSYAQKKGKKDSKSSSQSEKKDKDQIKSIEEVTKKCTKIAGLFTMYQDTTSGKAYLLVNADQLGKEYIHFNYVENGILEAGYFRGAYGDAKVLKINKYYNRIEIVEQNTDYYFDKDNALSRSAQANINTPILASEKIVGMNKAKNAFLIEADKVFLSEALQQIKYSPSPNSKAKNPFKIGSLSKDKTKYHSLKNYPANTDVVVEYVYENKSPTNYGYGTATDARFTTIKIQHSIIEMPDNDYKARKDDSRVGYFLTQTDDQLSASVTPYKDMIHRWHLVKKDPNAALSEPVEPITWWMENTTPEDLRPIIKAGVENWNIAFEAAGFKNAVVVKQQPDDADWDAGDIRYNVLRWTSSPIPPFGGYGPSFVNPRTGQILGADIMLEYVYITNRIKYNQIYNTGASLQEIMQEGDHQEHLGFPNSQSAAHYCQAGLHKQMAVQLGKTALAANGLGEGEMSVLLKESLYELVLHEVGHTLGLSHNFFSSQLHSPASINDRATTEKMGLVSSVMDYSTINLALDKNKQGQYFSTVPGPYDRWAIQYGYSPMSGDAEKQATDLNMLLMQSNKPELGYGNDADDMRSPGKGLDPRIMIDDLSSDGIGYAIDRIQLVKNIMPKLKTQMAQEGDTYDKTKNAYYTLMRQHSIAAGVISRYVGGMYINRSVVGQEGATQPLTPVATADQKRAMKGLVDHVFSPTAFDAPSDLYSHLRSKRRGWDHWSSTEDPKIHSQIAYTQKRVLAHVMHPQVLRRITDSELYGNDYQLDAMMTDLTDGIFKADARGTVNGVRQNLQMEYVNGLISAVGKGSMYHNAAQSMALYELNRINKMMQTASSPDTATKAHRNHITHKIEEALDQD